MLIKGKKILMVSTMGMNDLPTRKQRIAQILSQENEVIYLQAPLTLLGAWKNRSRLRGFLVSEKQHLTVIQPPVVLPFGLKFRSIHAINSILFSHFVRKMLFSRDFSPDLWWFYLPDFPELARQYPQSFKVYDCVDDHAAYPGLRNPVLVRKLEEQLVKTCDLVFATTAELTDRLEKFGKKVYCISNGVDWEHFGNNQVKEFSILRDIPHPRIGYLGAIHRWFDLDLIRTLLEKMPEIHIVLAGPSQRPDLDALSYHPRLHLLGRISLDQAPSCIEGFDVGLIPFIANDLTLNISPLKFFEYSSRGKPTVSLPINQLKSFGSLSYLYQDASSCIEQIQKALQEPEDLKNKRKALAKEYSWEGKFEEMFRFIAQASDQQR